MLVLLGAYWPGHDATGPNQSFRALATALGHDFAFKVVARDRPFGSDRALATAGEWVEGGHAQFRYCGVSSVSGARGLGDIVRTTPHDMLMMNGFFDREFTLPALMLRRLGRIPRRPVILSTRGEFAGGALGIKGGRKRAYLALARRLGLHRDVWLHATGPGEAEDIRRVYPFSRGVLVAPNVRRLGPLPAPPEPRAGTSPLRLAFLGRIARVKNLDYALRVLGEVRSPVSFDIFGPVGEAGYWQECRAAIARLPSNVTVTHKGVIANEDVPATLASYDALFLPTKGENFGHAIFDALEAGVPVLISDRTSFQDLERHGAGWSLPLADPSRFAQVIEEVAAMSEADRQRMRAAARRLAERTIEEGGAVARNREMLATVLAASSI